MSSLLQSKSLVGKLTAVACGLFTFSPTVALGLDLGPTKGKYYKNTLSWPTADGPTGITLLGGDIYVVATDCNCVQRFDSGGQLKKTWGSMGSGPKQFKFPSYIAAAEPDTLYIADTGNDRVQVFDKDGAAKDQWSGGDGEGALETPYGVTYAANGSVYVADLLSSPKIKRFSSAGEYLKGWDDFGSEPLFLPIGAASDTASNVYVANINPQVYKFDAEGEPLQTLEPPNWQQSVLELFDPPQWTWKQNSAQSSSLGAAGVAVDAMGNVFVVYPDNGWLNWVVPLDDHLQAPQGVLSDASLVRKYDSEGHLIWTFGQTGTGKDGLKGARGIAVDDDGAVYVADTGNDLVRKYEPKTLRLQPHKVPNLK